MKTKLDNIEKALQIAAKHKYGDGDYTAYFEKALADIKQVKEDVEGFQCLLSTALAQKAQWRDRYFSLYEKLEARPWYDKLYNLFRRDKNE